MNVALCLMAYGATVAVFGPPVLRGLTHRGVAPRLSVTAWLVAIGGALAAWVLAAALLVVEFTTVQGHSAAALRACFSILSTPVLLDSDKWEQVALYSLAGVVATGAVAAALRTAWVMWRMRRRTIAYGAAVRMVGRRVPGLGALVLDSPERQAYCVAGRPDTIVVTSGAVDVLTRAQLDAVLAHEHAHLRGRHAPLSALLRALSATLPLRLLRQGSAEIGRLLEMCADDRAARAHGREPLLGGMLALAGGRAMPVGALGAAGTAVLVRAERLATPVGRMHRVTNRTALLGVIAATVIGLVEIALGIMMCSALIR